MDQRRIDFDGEHLAAELARCGLDRGEVAVVMLLRCQGSKAARGDELHQDLVISKRDAAQATGLAPNTFARAAGRLAERGLIRVLRPSETDRRHNAAARYVLSIDRLAALAAPDDLLAEVRFQATIEADGTRGDNGNPPWSGVVQGGPPWSGVVRGGPGARVREEEIQRSRASVSLSCNRVFTGADQGGPPRTTPDQALGVDGVIRARFPWRALTPETLRSLDPRLVICLFREAVAAGWIAEDSLDWKRAFLALCRHVTTSRSIHNPVAVLQAAIKRGSPGLALQNVPDACREWAKQRLKPREESRQWAVGSGQNV